MNKPVVVLGGGGHAKVVAETLRLQGAKIVGMTAPTSTDIAASLQIYPWLGNDAAIQQNYSTADIILINGIGQVPQSRLRCRLYVDFKQKGYTFRSVIHPSAILASDILLGEGAQLMAGCIVQPSAEIGDNTLLNTRCSVDHDCRIGSHVHIAPGAVLAGGVIVEEEAFIGAGAIVIEGRRIGKGAVIGAGAVVVRDVPAGARYAGVPAKEMHP
ncbi:acetyltransferase [Cohnella sp. JJ-181]|uniref:acetyltransferase n=1 Tax=Cohnella rhizoplanae TaxID=2974897 RepID=UPI0022FF98E0|nr:acetyltransferase [Cohnella sp. JJ-181]CAI6084363.1 Putative acetyltransferase EpsM [Cohnella sp. JJ-181]